MCVYTNLFDLWQTESQAHSNVQGSPSFACIFVECVLAFTICKYFQDIWIENRLRTAVPYLFALIQFKPCQVLLFGTTIVENDSITRRIFDSETENKTSHNYSRLSANAINICAFILRQFKLYFCNFYRDCLSFYGPLKCHFPFYKNYS